LSPGRQAWELKANATFRSAEGRRAARSAERHGKIRRSGARYPSALKSRKQQPLIGHPSIGIASAGPRSTQIGIGLQRPTLTWRRVHDDRVAQPPSAVIRALDSVRKHLDKLRLPKHAFSRGHGTSSPRELLAWQKRLAGVDAFHQFTESLNPATLWVPPKPLLVICVVRDEYHSRIAQIRKLLGIDQI